MLRIFLLLSISIATTSLADDACIDCQPSPDQAGPNPTCADPVESEDFKWSAPVVGTKSGIHCSQMTTMQGSTNTALRDVNLSGRTLLSLGKLLGANDNIVTDMCAGQCEEGNCMFDGTIDVKVYNTASPIQNLGQIHVQACDADTGGLAMGNIQFPNVPQGPFPPAIPVFIKFVPQDGAKCVCCNCNQPLIPIPLEF